MSYGGWGPRFGPVVDTPKFSEHGWTRKALLPWDGPWQGLSTPARKAFLDEVKNPPNRATAPNSPTAGIPVTALKPEILEELVNAGFVRVQPSSARGKPDRVVAAEGVGPFRTRLRALEKIQPLEPGKADAVDRYIETACYPHRLAWFVSEVLREAKLEITLDYESARAYLMSARWPEMVLKALGDPRAARIIDLLRDAPGPIPIDALTKQAEEKDPGAARQALDRLIDHLAVFEDLDRKTLAIVVGLLPEVRKKLAAAARTERPPLVAVESPGQVGPDTGFFVDDLRAFLLEIAGEPPRLRQDGAIFSKELPRFFEAMPPLPYWLDDSLAMNREMRLENAYSEASSLKLAKEKHEGKALLLQLTTRGQAWLSADAASQYTQVYDEYRILPKQGASPYDYMDFEVFERMTSYYYSYAMTSDRIFLGSDYAVVPIESEKKGKKRGATPGVDDLKALREALGKAFLELPEGAYYRFDDLVAHFASGPRSVLNLGRPHEEVRIFFAGRSIAPLEELREQVARRAVMSLILGRLIPLGALRAGTDAQGNLAVARSARLAAYFGLGPMPETAGAAAAEDAKVVVQPDFSVVVIGLSTAALAELIPFCERASSGSAGPGASILKITRESITRAIAQGLKPAQILDRLRKHASHEPPANVLRQVQDWAGWVRSIKATRVTLLRCPDRDTADRVLGVLKKQVERLNDTTLALNGERLLPADRKKLKDNGILLGNVLDGDPAPKKKPKSRRDDY